MRVVVTGGYGKSLHAVAVIRGALSMNRTK